VRVRHRRYAAGVSATACAPHRFGDLSVQLHVLDDKINQMYQELHSLQRFGTPYDVEVGTPHAGLTGAGAIALGDRRPIGLKYVLTTVNPGQPIYPGNPPYMWNQGWLSIDNADGLIDELRVTRTAAEWFPPRMLLADSINYALDPGVTMTLTELFAQF